MCYQKLSEHLDLGPAMLEGRVCVWFIHGVKQAGMKFRRNHQKSRAQKEGKQMTTRMDLNSALSPQRICTTACEG